MIIFDFNGRVYSINELQYELISIFLHFAFYFCSFYNFSTFLIFKNGFMWGFLLVYLIVYFVKIIADNKIVIM